MGIELASVLVPIIADLSRFGPQTKVGITTAMSQIAPTVTAAGAAHGENYGKGFNKAGQEEVKKGSTGYAAALSGVAKVITTIAAVEVFKGFIDGAQEAARTSRLTEAAIASTGGVAHVTAGHVEELALAISNKTGVDIEQVHSGENLLLIYSKVRNEVGAGNDIYDRATKLAVDMSVVLGKSVPSATAILGKALQDPIKGLTSLRKVGIQFTDQQKEQIKTLVKSGDLLDAQKIILDNVGKSYAGAAAAAADPITKLENTLHNLALQLGAALLPAAEAFAGFLSANVIPVVGTFGNVLSHIPPPLVAITAAFVTIYEASKVATSAFETWTSIQENASKIVDFFAARAAAAAAATAAEGAAAEGAGVATGQLALDLGGAAVAGTAEAASADAAAAATTRMGLAAEGAGTAIGTLLGKLIVIAGAVGFAAVTVQAANWVASASVARGETDKLATSLTHLSETQGSDAFRHLFDRAGIGGFAVDAQSATEAMDQFQSAAAIAFGSSWTDRAQRMITFGTVATQANEQIKQLDLGISQLASSGHAQAAQAAFAQLEVRMRAAGVSESEFSKMFPQFYATMAGLHLSVDGVSEAAARLAASNKKASAEFVAEVSPVQQIQTLFGSLASAQNEVTLTLHQQHTAHVQFLADLQAIHDQTLANINSELGLKDAEARLTDAVSKNGRTLNVNTQAGRDNWHALLDVTAAVDNDIAVHQKAGEPMRQFAQRVAASRQELITEAQKAGMSAAAAQNYANKILAVPTKQVTQYLTPGAAAAKKAADDVRNAIRAIQSETVTVRINADGSFTQIVRTASGGVSSRTGRALGGPIPGASPTPTADNVPIMATAGEHMWSVAEVAGAGGHAAVAGLRALARSGQLPGFASGGPVNRSMTTKYEATLPAGHLYSDAVAAGLVLAGQRAAKTAQAAAAAAKAAAATQAAVGSVGGSGVTRWTSMVLQALRIMGQPSSLLATTLRRMNQESGGNPTAINKWDSNWVAGTPSVGLMQVIGPTYARYRHGGYNRAPFAYGVSEDPLSNTLASMGYAITQYGSLASAYNRAGGYDTGGWLMPGAFGYNATSRPERVLSPQQSEAHRRGGGHGGQVVVHVYFDGQIIDDRVRVVVEDGLASTGLAIDNA